MTDIEPALAELGVVHFIAIGGAGMSVVAQLMHDRGVVVQGSDGNPSAILDSLSAQGIPTWVGHDTSHLAGADTVVISSAIKEANVELREARRLGLPVLHRSEALARLMVGRDGIAVAGAHGKTTTSAMIAVMLRELGADPSFAIGGTVQTQSGPVSGGYAGAGSALVAEADESDGSFLNYQPAVAVVTNIEPDHLDHYGSRAAFEAAFAQFAGRIVRGGLLVVCADDAGAARLSAAMRAGEGAADVDVVTYGESADADYRILNISTGSDQSGFQSRTDLLAPGGEQIRLNLRVPGQHNALNAVSALAVASHLGYHPQEAARALEFFLGTGRRFDQRGEISGVKVIDDYAHHPTEVKAVIAAAKSIAGTGRVLVVFQPHLYSRTAAFAAEFAQALELADLAVVCDVYGARERFDPSITPHTITDLAADPLRLRSIEDRDQAARWLANQAVSGDVILLVGAGDIPLAAAPVLETLAADTVISTDADDSGASQ